MTRRLVSDVRVDGIDVAAFRIPTEEPESDGTLEWDSTTIVVVESRGGGKKGLGYSYAHRAAALLIEDELAPVAMEWDALDVRGAWAAMQAKVRNLIRRGLTQMAISAVDVALWDLKARLLDTPLSSLLGTHHEAVPVYGSGGFTSYPVDRLQDQVAGWVEQGIRAVKMKVGRTPDEDPDRVHAARKAIGDTADLLVDANNAYDAKQALQLSHRFAEAGVSWFEEPVGSDDFAAMAMLRGRFPPGMELAGGEYGDTIEYYGRMIDQRAVDVAQPDITRCGGVTAFLGIAALCEANQVPLSAHTAPQLDAHVCGAAPTLRHAEYFHDHVRIEKLLFDGVLEPVDGKLVPDRTSPGMGLELRWPDAEPYLVHRTR